MFGLFSMLSSLFRTTEKGILALEEVVDVGYANAIKYKADSLKELGISQEDIDKRIE